MHVFGPSAVTLVCVYAEGILVTANSPLLSVLLTVQGLDCAVLGLTFSLQQRAVEHTAEVTWRTNKFTNLIMDLIRL